MTPDEAVDILEALTVAFPRHGLTEVGIESWADAIQDSGADPMKSLEIAKRWARTHQWFPALAEFLAAVAPRWVAVEAEDPDEWRVPPAVAREMTALWRDELAKVDKRRVGAGRGLDGHWHGGPEPCPMCGGMRSFR